MGTLNEDLSAIKEVEDKIVANKVARFAYTDEAYTTNDANGVTEYDFDNAQNIPTADASVLKVNETVLSKGYRAQASSVTRMLLNHFFGRMSYNLNKVNDNVSNLIETLLGHRGTANGYATLDSNGKIPYSQLPESAIENGNLWSDSWRGKVFGHLFGKVWTKGTGSNTTYSFSTVYYANGIWVAGSRDNGLWWSTDGKAWAQGTGGNTTYAINTVYYANGICVAGSQGNGLWWSTDGKAWTQGTGGNTTYSINTVYYANGIWVAGSRDNGLWWSTDGKAWTQGAGNNTKLTFRPVYYANGIWITVSENNGLWYSDYDLLVEENVIKD